MMRRFVFVFWLGAMATACAQSLPGTWKLTFSDEFDGTSLDTTKWTVGYHFNAVINNERQHYVPENVILDGNGILKFKAEKRHVTEAPPNLHFAKEYASGQIESWGKFTQTYGLFEASIKMPKAKGLWPAFWMMPDRGEQFLPANKRMSTFDDGMEIDTMEYLTAWGDYTHTGAVWDGYGKQSRAFGAGGIDDERCYVKDISGGFHTYSVYWEKGRLLFFVDGVLLTGMSGDRVPSCPMEIILNCAIGGKWPESVGKIDDSALPDYMEVDWVHVYEGTLSPDVYVPAKLDSFPYGKGGTPLPLPGKIEAGQFNYGKKGVSFEASHNNWTKPTYRKEQKKEGAESSRIIKGESGNWFKYTVKSPKTDDYTVTLRALAEQGGSVSIFMDDDKTPIATFDHFSTDWSTKTADKVQIPEGEHTLRVALEGKGVYVDWLQFESGL